MDSDGYYSTYVPAFTAEEKTKLKELFGKGITCKFIRRPGHMSHS